ncbi:MAG: relaxase/mobilization nuclease RlxS [Rhodospirillaceae bacterium]
MSRDDTFTPRLGKIRNRGGKVGKTFLKSMAIAVTQAGFRRGRNKFTGVRSGRGAGAGRVLSAREAAYRARRVMVKARFVKIKGRGLGAAQAHLRYIQRDGVTRDGQPGELYGPELDRTDGAAFLKRCEEDRHQFRFIVSAEDGDRYEDLKPFVRRVMRQMEQDLGTKLDWVAVDHHNTGHPHTHVVLRGRTDKNKDLIIARDYLSAGMRARAAEIATFDLGLQTDLEIEARRTREVELERFTPLDANLCAEQSQQGHVLSVTKSRNPKDDARRAGRLQKLGRLGLATEVRPGTWALADDTEARLRAIGQRGDIIKTLHQELKAKHVSRAPTECAIYDPTDLNARTVTGRVIAKGLADEISDRQFVILDGTDGFSHYIDIGRPRDDDPVTEGSIVAVSPKAPGARTVDHRIAKIAQANGGIYDEASHQRFDPKITHEFALTHVRRLEAIRKLTGGVERASDGGWTIGPDYLEKAAAYERRFTRTSPVEIETLSSVAIERQAKAEASTWLDQELTKDQPTPLRDAGFGREARQALLQRQDWLISQNLAHREDGRVVYRKDLLQVLRRREMTRAGTEIAKEHGMTYSDYGREIAGIYRKSIRLVSGRFAMIETSRSTFTLVPWRAVLERNLGSHVAGILRGGNISWTLGREKGLSR